MTYILRVPQRTQASPTSCWWACLASLLEYHHGRRLGYPIELDPIFGQPYAQGRPPASDWVRYYPDQPWPEDGVLGHRLRHDDQFARYCRAARASPGGFLAPEYWYDNGVPVDPPHLGLLVHVANLARAYVQFRDASSYGSRDYARLENALRNYGPLIVVKRVGGGHHAYLVHGVDSVAQRLVYWDPEGGQHHQPMEAFTRNVERGLEPLGLAFIGATGRRPDPVILFDEPSEEA